MENDQVNQEDWLPSQEEMLEAGKVGAARKPIRSLISEVHKKVNHSPDMDPKKIIEWIIDLVKSKNLENELLSWAEIRKMNNEQYPLKEGVCPSLDSLATIDDLIAEAGLQLK